MLVSVPTRLRSSTKNTALPVTRPQPNPTEFEMIEQMCNPGIRPLHAEAGLVLPPSLQRLMPIVSAEIHIKDQLGRHPICWYAVEAGDRDITGAIEKERTSNIARCGAAAPTPGQEKSFRREFGHPI